MVVGGATASGKTRFAIELAKYFQTVILSGDSRQFYREMNIGTAKPSLAERKEAPHFFIDNLSIHQNYSVGDFERDAIALLDDLFTQRNIVILAGGSGLYINAICKGMDDFPEVPSSLKEALNNWYEQNGLEALQNEVKRADPAYFDQVDRSNPHRLLRALAVYKASGKPFSSFRRATGKERNFYPIFIWLDWPREALYDRINKRVEVMIQNGLIEEAKSLHPYNSATALQTVGYQELFDFLDGKTELQEAIELIKRNSRRYAKRQLTWYRRDGFWKTFHPDEFNQALKFIQASLKSCLSIKEEKISEPLFPVPVQKFEIRDGSGCRFQIKWKEEKPFTILFDLEVHQEAGDEVVKWGWHEVFKRIENYPLWFVTTNKQAENSIPVFLKEVPPMEVPERLQKWFPQQEGIRWFYARSEVSLNQD